MILHVPEALRQPARTVVNATCIKVAGWTNEYLTCFRSNVAISAVVILLLIAIIGTLLTMNANRSHHSWRDL